MERIVINGGAGCCCSDDSSEAERPGFALIRAKLGASFFFGVKTMQGSCLCGQIAYEVSRLDSPIQHCSCRTCRKAHAAAFNTAATVKHEHFRWLRGQDKLKSFESSPGKLRHFCGHCGSQLVAQRAGVDALILRVATLDDDPGQTPQWQIWASHEVPWLRYGHDVVSYPEWEPERV